MKRLLNNINLKLLISIILLIFNSVAYSKPNNATMSIYGACYFESKELFDNCKKYIKRKRTNYHNKNINKCQSLMNEEIYDCIGNGKDVPVQLKKFLYLSQYAKPTAYQIGMSRCFKYHLAGSAKCKSILAKKRRANKSDRFNKCIKSNNAKMISCAKRYLKTLTLRPPIEERFYKLDDLNENTKYAKGDLVWAWFEAKPGSGKYIQAIALDNKSSKKYIMIQPKSKPNQNEMVLSKWVRKKPNMPDMTPALSISKSDYTKSQMVAKALLLTQEPRKKIKMQLEKNKKIEPTSIKLDPRLHGFIQSVKATSDSITYRFKKPFPQDFQMVLKPIVDFNGNISWECSINNANGFNYVPDQCKNIP